MGCWVTSSFYNSQPLVMDVAIPENRTNVTLILSRGMGEFWAAKVHKCVYAQCTNYQYFNFFCPTIATVGFGYTDLTTVLPAGNYRIELEGIGITTSTAISGAMLNVTYPVVSLDATEKVCNFYANETACTVNLTIYGQGQCVFPTSAVSANITNALGQVQLPSALSNGSLSWNCTFGNYLANLTFLPLQVLD